MAASLLFPIPLVRRAGTLLALLALFGLAAQAADPAPAGAAKAPLPSVVVAAIEEGMVDKQDRFIGTIKAIQSVDLKARVEGFLTQVAFKQGAMVTENELLYQIEPAPFQAALDSAKADLGVAQADLVAAQADLLNKQLDLDRQDALIKKGDTSQAARDKAKAQRDESAAAVGKAKANIDVANAAIVTAQINLGYTTMTSPIAGRIGPTKYTQGNLVNTSSGVLATVVQLDPIRAVFSIPSAIFVRVAELSSKEGLEAVRGKYVPQLILPTGETYQYEGKIAFVDNQIDASTGTIAVYADFPNPEQMLLPGQFISAVIHKAKQTRLPLVPAGAVQRTKDGEQVYVIGSGNRVEVREIKTSTQVGTNYAVTSGLRTGDIVIVAGAQKVKAGMVVNPVKQSAANAESQGQGGDKTGDGASGGAKPETRP